MAHRFPAFLLSFALAVSTLSAAQTSAAKRKPSAKPAAKPAVWTVKPEWVRADESFLASDALQGRGSATRDEWIAAQFVASRFESFGLQPAAPDKSFVEKVELVSPKLDGKAQIAAGDVTLNEGPDFYLLTASGESVAGKLQKLPASDVGTTPIAPGSAVLITGLSEDGRAVMQTAQRLRASGAIVLLPDSAAMKQIFQRMLGGKTRVPLRVKEVESPSELGRAGNIVVLAAEAYGKVSALADGAAISLSVHVLPEPPAYTYNAVGKIEGSDPAAGAVLLSAHLDHLGVRQNQTGDTIYNGADDDASGTTAVIELARAMSAIPRPKRTVYFVCFGSEETGGQGDDYFRNHPPVPLAQIVANIEFEMIGAQDPKMPKGVLLLTGFERSDLGPTLQQHGAKIGPDPYPEQHFFERSDNYALALKGVIAHTAAGWGTPPYYHRPDDDLAHLDITFMTEVIQSFVAPIEWLANSDFKPQWKEGGQPKR